MKVLWNLDNTKAVPMRHIKVFEIKDETENMNEVLREMIGVKNYSVIVRYQICNAEWCRVFTADTKSECIHFIDQMEEYL